MSVADMFKTFLDSLKVDNSGQISDRYGEITASLNKQFRDTESKEANTLRVGSYGRYTGIKGISDLDMLYIMPKGKWDTYKDGKQSQLLSDTREAIKARYPRTDVRVDRLVVTVSYTNFHVEVQPVFEETDEDGSIYYTYPDTYKGGSWKTTKPRHEMQAVREMDDKKNKNLRLLCKMARSWKNNHGVGMGGLLIDTLAYNFMRSTDYFNDKSFLYYDYLSRDFFKYLMDEHDKEHYKAPGSNQNVKVKKKFQRKAKEAHELCLRAIEAEESETVNDKWKKVYGRSFPAKPMIAEDALSKAENAWRDTEEFIEDLHPVDIRYNISIDCDVSQNGFREHSLVYMLLRHIPLLANKTLMFRVSECDVPEPYTLKWKVLNRGIEAERRDCVRGQIVLDEGYKRKRETTNFVGNHVVECFAVKNGVVVAKDIIDVPIK